MGDALTPGHIYDSNGSSIAAAVIAAGGAPQVIGIARDNLDDLHRCIDAASDADLLVTSAGVSKGDYDMVKDVLEQRGDMNFWSVRMRPAKPLAFGLLHRRQGNPLPLLGLPGNPVSRAAGFRDVWAARPSAGCWTRPAGASHGGRGAHRPHLQQRWPPGLCAGGPWRAAMAAGSPPPPGRRVPTS